MVRLRSMHFVMRPLLPQRVLFLHRAQHRRRVDAAGALAARRQPVGRSASGSDSGGGAGTGERNSQLLLASLFMVKCSMELWFFVSCVVVRGVGD